MVSTATEVRTAREGDLDEVARIERDLFADPWSRRSFSGLVGAANVAFTVACVEERVVGYSVVIVAEPESELANIAVDRQGQGRGIGRSLLASAMTEARGQGCSDMWLEVRESNAAARAMYASAGFAEVGRRARYYSKPVEDAIVMRVELRAES